MNWENIGILLGFGAVVGYVGYTICLFNPIRLLVFSYVVYWIYQSIITKDDFSFFVLGSASLVFIIRFYRLNPYFCKKIFKPFILLFSGGAKAGKFALSVADGTLTGRKKLQRERAEFEREKAFYEREKRRVDEEWEKIERAWKKWEARTGQRREEYKEYEESREKTGTKRYFKEFAKFDLDKFEKNDPYEVLGVSRTASKREILLAYKDLIFQFHPDKFHKAPQDKQDEAHKIACLLNYCREDILN